MRRTLIAIAIAAAVAVPSIGQAKTFRWAAQGDICLLYTSRCV